MMTLVTALADACPSMVALVWIHIGLFIGPPLLAGLAMAVGYEG